MKSYYFTSECVSPGHPDKISDQISDAMLDACLAEDNQSRVAFSAPLLREVLQFFMFA